MSHRSTEHPSKGSGKYNVCVTPYSLGSLSHWLAWTTRRPTAGAEMLPSLAVETYAVPTHSPTCPFPKRARIPSSTIVVDGTPRNAFPFLANRIPRLFKDVLPRRWFPCPGFCSLAVGWHSLVWLQQPRSLPMTVVKQNIWLRYSCS